MNLLCNLITHSISSSYLDLYGPKTQQADSASGPLHRLSFCLECSSPDPCIAALACNSGLSSYVTWSALVAQWVEDSVLSLQQLGLLLRHGFDPWPGNFHRQ